MNTKRANIIKFKKDKRYIIHPISTLQGGGGIASSPYIVEHDLSYIVLAEKLLESLSHSMVDVPKPLNWDFFRKEYLNSMGMKNMKMLHEDSLSIGVFTRDDNYVISPTKNEGSRKGFQGLKDKIIIPINSSLEDLAIALEDAFEKSK